MATTIAGITVKFREFRQLPDELGGGPRRTVSGALRGDALWTKRAWSGIAYVRTGAAADTLRAAVGPNTPVTVTGALFHGASVSAIVEVLNAGAERASGGFFELLELSIREA